MPLKISSILPLLFCFCFVLSGCASSEVSRDAASSVDKSVLNAKGMMSGTAGTSIAESYQNTSQAAKGAIIGGAAGAVTGVLSSGVGIIPGTATGIILGASYGSYIDTKVSPADQLENRGANVVVLGDQILIIIPSARIFNFMTATIKQEAYSTLYLAAHYINGYTKILVKVSVYTDDTGSKRLDLSLSQQQAESVAKVLLSGGINARVLYAAGYGGTHLVTQNSLEWDSDNYRIEIALEKLYV